MIPRILTVCLSCSFLVYSAYGAPQRSIQLGGGGPRPVALGGPNYQDGPIYSQQLAFGPPQPQHQHLQQPTQAQLQQQQQQQGRLRIPQHLQQAQQQPQPSRLLLAQQQLQQQPLLQQAKPFTLQPFPGAGGQHVRGQQPLLLKSPGNPQGLAQDEEEYEDEEYEEDPAASPAPAPSPSPRPVQIHQRGQPIRIAAQPQPLLLGSPGQPGPGPQRFVVPQQALQPQPTPQQIRRPVQQRVIPAPAPVQSVQQPQYQSRQPIQQQQPQPQQSRNTLGSDSRLKNRVSTPPPVQTINRFMRNNPDGSITWGYENEDGTFKEETLGADCVVRGKYGYVDPEGQKREYEYQQGNPCDPNKKDQPEEEEEEVIGGPNRQQQLGGLLTARPSQGQLQQRRPAPQQQLVYQQ